jgi:hypothetical protein
VNRLGAFNPISSLDTKSSNNIGSFEEFVNVGEIVTKRRIGAFIPDIVYVESRLCGKACDASNSELTFFHSE